jgi:hypothetical protein
MPDDAAPQGFYYQGFSSPNGTIVPDDVFDVLLPQLTDIELRVLLYIVRRTFGFKRSSDDISLRQLVEGITTKDGRVLDRGAGVSKPSAVKAVKGLTQKGIVVAQRNSSAERGDEPTTYALRFADPVLTGFTRGGKSDLHGGVNGVDTQQTGIQETVRQQTVQSSNGFEGEMLHKRDVNFPFSRKRNPAKNQFESTEGQPSQRERREAPAPIGQLLADRRGDRHLDALSETRRSPRSDFSDASGMESHPPAKRGRPPKVTPQIVALIEQFSGEFHDDDHVKPNISHAARLWKESRLPEDAFCQRLYEARSITKQYDVQKRAEGEAGKWGARNKMPYYFVVLRDLLGMKDDRDSRSPTASP